jgi:hypothetical protein
VCAVRAFVRLFFLRGPHLRVWVQAMRPFVCVCVGLVRVSGCAHAAIKLHGDARA